MASSDPVYLRVVDDLRRQIVNGSLAPGAVVPSRAQLTRRYGVGETAARHALRVLTTEGLIFGRVGSGHYVRERATLVPLHRSRFHDHHAPLAADLHSQGRRVSWVWRVERVRATPELADRLRLPEYAPIVRTRHIYRSNGKPVQLTWSYEPAELAEGQPVPAEGTDSRKSVVARMAAVGLNVTDIVETVRTRVPEPAEIDALDLCAGVHILHLERTHHAGSRPLETSDTVVPGDAFHLVYTLRP
ncbi:GntR family transcriptional regulator [Streptosporangium sp. KLBMP 9127]|nr:GntR family transcriptional regulator [Streptosporangium sp. KLBMP 9127]